MDNVSRPMIALLVGTVAFFALWVTMLKPSSKDSSSQGAGQYQSAIAKAKAAVGTSAAASVAHGGTVGASTPPGGGALKTATTAAHPASAAAAVKTAQNVASAARTKPATTPRSTATAAALAAKHRYDVVTRALAQHRVIAMLFYNPAEADDHAVKQELAGVPAHGRKVLKLTVPLNELTRYTVVTNQVPVNQSPTLVVIDPHGQASTIVGFTDRFEIEQRISDALALA